MSDADQNDSFGAEVVFICPDCELPLTFGPMDDGWLIHCEPCGHYISGPDLHEAFDVLCEVLAEEEEEDEEEDDDWGEEGAYDDGPLGVSGQLADTEPEKN